MNLCARSITFQFHIYYLIMVNDPGHLVRLPVSSLQPQVGRMKE